MDQTRKRILKESVRTGEGSVAYMRERYHPEEHTAKQRWNGVPAQVRRAAAPGRAAGGELPFPNKPVFHRTLKKMEFDFEKMALSSQRRGPSLSQEANRKVHMANEVYARDDQKRERRAERGGDQREKLSQAAKERTRSTCVDQGARWGCGDVETIQNPPSKMKGVQKSRGDGGRATEQMDKGKARAGKADEREQKASAKATAMSAGIQFVPCGICSRTFMKERVEKHMQVCERVKRKRKVFNSYRNRTKGSAIEQFNNNNVRSKTPEGLKRKKMAKK